MSDPAYRIDGYVVWKRVPASGGPVSRCCRCSRPAAFLRIKHRRKASGESYDLAGFCGFHAPDGIAGRLAKEKPCP
jgi:hypothetical protein